MTKKKILLVDDNKVILSILTYMLEKMGHEVKSSEDGLSALEILDSYLPDIMFIDLIMPNIGGDVLCRIIRKRKEFDSIFLTLLSAVVAEEQVDFQSFGADACIPKGIAKEMESHIVKVLDHLENDSTLPFHCETPGSKKDFKREIIRELLSKKKHFEITLENMGSGFLELTWSGQIIFANSMATVFFDCPEERFLSSNFLDYFSGKQREYVEEHINRLQREPVEIGEGHPIFLNEKYILIKFVPVVFGEQKSIIAIIDDITQRKKTEEKLNEHMLHLEDLVTERTKACDKINKELQGKILERTRLNAELEFVARQWSTTFDTIPDFISVHDQNMQIVRVNKALAEFLGEDPEEIIGKSCHEVMHGKNRPWPNCPHTKAIDQNRVITEEVNDPSIGIPLLVTCSPCFHDDGSLMGTVHVARDISQQKQTAAEQDALIEQLKEAYQIINESQIVACRWENTKGRPLQFVSENVVQLTGYSKDDFLSDKITFHQMIHPEDIDEVQHEIIHNSQQSDITGFIHEPYRIITKNKQIKWISDRSEICRDDDGNITHYQGLIEDITKRKDFEEKEQELLIQHEQLKNLESLKTMAGAIAHRFNNAMMAVQGNLDLITLALPFDSEVYKMASDASKAARGASQVGTMMLSYVGQQPLHSEKLPLSDVVKKSLDALKHLHQPSIALSFTPPSQPLYCSLDRKQIKEVVEIVLTNAIEAQDENSGTIEISFGSDYFTTDSFSIHFQDDTLKDGTYAFFQIKDTGHGISTENIQRIFEPFYTTRFIGRGLGLAMTAGIMKSHHGAIIVKSTPDVETTVKILFPLLEVSQHPKLSSRSTQDEIMKMSGNILFVDDEASVLFIGKKMFELLGFTVHTAANGREAVNMVSQKDTAFRAVVMDVSMPEMDGIEAMKAIRNIDATMPVVLDSGYSEDYFSFTEDQGNKPDGFLRKPFLLSDLHECLKNLLYVD